MFSTIKALCLAIGAALLLAGCNSAGMSAPDLSAAVKSVLSERQPDMKAEAQTLSERVAQFRTNARAAIEKAKADLPALSRVAVNLGPLAHKAIDDGLLVINSGNAQKALAAADALAADGSLRAIAAGAVPADAGAVAASILKTVGKIIILSGGKIAPLALTL